MTGDSDSSLRLRTSPGSTSELSARLSVFIMIILAACMKCASSEGLFVRPAAASGISLVEHLDWIPIQQTSPTSTPTLTPTGTISPTLAITTTPSTSPTLTLAPATATPSVSVSPTISSTPSQTIQISSETATLGISQTLEPTLTISPALSATDTSAMTGTLQFETPLITQTATLIPYPTINLRIPTMTRTPSLYLLDGKEGSSNLEKDNFPLLSRLNVFLPLLIVLVLWGFLIAWFVVVQVLDRR